MVLAFAYCDPAGLLISTLYFNTSRVGKYFGVMKFDEVNCFFAES
jgi:hypothetical protein